MDEIYEEVQDLLQRMLRGVDDANTEAIVFYHRM